MYLLRAGIVLIAALALTLGLAACDADNSDDNGEGMRGSGNVVTEEKAFADFTAVDVQNMFVVDIARSDSFSVTIRADDNILDFVDVSKAGDTLRIRLDLENVSDPTLEAEIEMPELKRLSLSLATQANVSGFTSLGEVDIDLSLASGLEGDLQAGSVNIDASTASRVKLEGSATALTVNGSEASSLDLADFTVDTAEVSLSGASQATVNVDQRIDPVDVSGSSRLRYLGDPSLENVTTSGASTVEKGD